MDETFFTNLPVSEKAEFVLKNGQFIEAEDYYSYHTHVYLLGEHYINLIYDFSGNLLSVEPAAGQETIEVPARLSSNK